MTAKKKPAAPKAAAPKPEGDGMVDIVCTCDRLPLVDGHVLVRGMTGRVPEHEAVNYEAAERAKRA
jgi:hypothetical protein